MHDDTAGEAKRRIARPDLVMTRGCSASCCHSRTMGVTIELAPQQKRQKTLEALSGELAVSVVLQPGADGF